MEVIIENDAAAVAELAAHIIGELVRRKPDATLGLATGSTPVETYKALIKLHRETQLSFKNISTFNLDEYIGIAEDNAQSYRSFMQNKLFESIDIDVSRTYFPRCESDQNPAVAGLAYEHIISEVGGIDLQILGIGSNGHIGFNEPTSSFASKTRVKTLTPSTIADNSRLFADDEFQPHLAMTMGIATILATGKILLLATGRHKAQAVRDAVEGALSAICPASSLQLHQNAVLIVDSQAASKLKHTQYYQWARKENQIIKDKFGYFPSLGN